MFPKYVKRSSTTVIGRENNETEILRIAFIRVTYKNEVSGSMMVRNRLELLYI